jgi:hypothetical protein
VKEMELPPIPAISFPTTPDPRWHVLRFVGKSRKVKLLIHNATLHSHGPANQPATDLPDGTVEYKQRSLGRSFASLWTSNNSPH